MDDLLGLSWDQTGARNGNIASNANGTGGMSAQKAKPPPPPPTSKPAHLQMGLSKVGLVPTPAGSSASILTPQPVRSNNGLSATSAPKKNADDVFGSLMPAFGQSNATGVAKNLNAMTLEERRRHDQQQQLKGSLNNSSGYSSPSSGPFAYASAPGFSQPSRSAISPGMNASPLTPKGYDPGNIAGMQRTFAASSPAQPQPTFAAPTPTFQQPQQSLLNPRYNTPPPGQSTTKAVDPWDLDFLANATSVKSSQPAPATNSDLFDLGAFEKAPVEKPARQRDSVDALNSFIGKQPSPSTTSTSSSSSRSSPPASRQAPASKPPRSAAFVQTTSSREDADIAQIVSMGFPAERAKLALAMTESGRDIEAAVEYLVQNDEAEDHLPARRRTPVSAGREARAREERRPYRDGSDPPLEDRRRRNPRQTQAQSQQQQELSRAQQLQQHKDKIVGTASVFGMSVLTKANEIYKQGREKMQAAMEDMAAEEPRTSAARRHEWIEDEFNPRKGGYKDSDSEDEVYKGRRQPQRPQDQRQQQQQPQQQQRDARAKPEKETFEDTYVSSSRRGGASAKSQPLFSMEDTKKGTPRSSNLSTAATAASSSSSASASRTARSSSPLPPKPARPPRVLVQANGQQLQESNHYKEKGNEVFKLGQFGQAAELYARAGQSLPAGHILLILTQNNRAAALLKIGEYRETIAECDRSILLVQGPDGQGVNDMLPPSAGDQLGKALMRRATAYENLEKYQEAKDDWAKLRDLDPGHRNAVEGHRRCEKAIAMVNGGTASSLSYSASSSPSARKPSPSSSSSLSPAAGRSTGLGVSSPMQDIFASHQSSHHEAKVRAELERSEGVTKLRQSAAQQEREDDEKLRLSDQVERKMTLWKAGKEDNIRALLASLGSVLWEGVGWKAVGMHELVTPAQVKIKYMRAIGKMHPDKLSATTTVEQRMLANTIFSTLNSAWDAFKAQNNM
ncbi:hypothetical protein BGZ70_008664 [Mortierella alpina]|uniref:UBA domain-containing protein n=1 Tax=Mortierella alpina TaxID=64518 RepID=A0A9P6M0L0_MORAP|nr:hypothetical protein BGZ70_008664 [Mortierella alpina]